MINREDAKTPRRFAWRLRALAVGKIMRYVDEEGREVFVSDGLAAGKYWAAFRRKPNGISVKRIKTKFLPLRKRREEAQADLNAYASRKGWQSL